jgi:hypothetical protein
MNLKEQGRSSRCTLNLNHYAMISYIKKHWRGELSLGISYWLNSFLGNIVAVSAVTAINVNIADSPSPTLILAAAVTQYSLLFAVSVWQITGTWRSANNHKQDTGRKFWASAAQAMLVLGIINTAQVMIVGTKQVTELAKIAIGIDDFSEYSIEVNRETDLVVDGYITFQLISQFEEMLRVNPKITLIHLNSEGGRVTPGRKLSELIISQNLNTYSDTTCQSICTVVFMAGKYRAVAPGTSLGFHQYYFVGTSRDDIQIQEQTDGKFFKTRGIPDSFIQKVFNISSDQMWFPTFRELMDANIVTHVYFQDKFMHIKEYCGVEDCNIS